MVILHFACIDNSKTSGVCIAVRQHAAAQGRFAETAIVNTNGIVLDDTDKQILCPGRIELGRLPAPFDRPDLAVFHECYRPAYLAIAAELRKHAIPYVIVPHGELCVAAQKKKRLKKAAANLLLFNRFINGAAALQCLSENEERSTRFGKRKFVGTNGIDLPETVKSNFHETGTDFIYIGRYEWRVKGLDLLFDAIKAQESFLRENGCRFLLYGPDVYGRFAAVSAMVREREIGDLVRLEHEILGEEKKNALLNADVFIQTSRHEGMPMGILEAMSFGLPCLVTTGTSLGKEIADAQAGWTAETTAEAIAARLIEAVRDRPHWAEYGRNGRDAVRKSFAWESVAAETVRRYKEVISESIKE